MDPLVAFDEAGNSGPYLLDPEQPIFTLASVSLGTEAARELLPGRASEYKFSSLRRSAAGQRAVLSVLDSPLLTPEVVLVSVVHKPFMAVTKMVDLLVEPMLYRDGIDLYARGGNIALANMWHFFFPATLGRSVFDELLARFVQMVRQPTTQSVERFYQFVETGLRKHRRQVDLVGELALLRATRRVAEDSASQFDGSLLDPAIPTFVEHGGLWTGRFNAPFTIVHDTSKPIFNEQLVLEAMMSASEPRKEIGFDRRKMQFPIAAHGVEFRDSKICPQIQVADLLAGAFGYCMRGAPDEDGFRAALMKTRALDIPILPIIPEPKVTPEELGTAETGGIDPNEHVGGYVAKKLGGIPPIGQRRKPLSAPDAGAV